MISDSARTSNGPSPPFRSIPETCEKCVRHVTNDITGPHNWFNDEFFELIFETLAGNSRFVLDNLAKNWYSFWNTERELVS
jgi:hypothetical protein